MLTQTQSIMKKRNSKKTASHALYSTVNFMDIPNQRSFQYYYMKRLYNISLPSRGVLPEGFENQLRNCIEEDMAMGIHDNTLKKYEQMIQRKTIIPNNINDLNA